MMIYRESRDNLGDVVEAPRFITTLGYNFVNDTSIRVGLGEIVNLTSVLLSSKSCHDSRHVNPIRIRYKNKILLLVSLYRLMT